MEQILSNFNRMGARIEFNNDDHFMNQGMGRTAIVIMNCDVSQYQTLIDLGLLRAGDKSWHVGNGDMNLLNTILLREEYRRDGASDAERLVEVPIPKMKAAIEFLVNFGIDINYFQPYEQRWQAPATLEEVDDPYYLISYGTPIEIALYRRQYDMVQFLKSLGANPPRPLPILAEARDGFRQWVSMKTAWNSGRKSANNFSTMPKNILELMGSIVSGKKGGRRTRRRRL